jgi:hypothetical protein
VSTPTRLAVFAGGLVVAFATAWGVGSFVDPLLDEPLAAHDMGEDAGAVEDHAQATHLPGGLMVSQDGYALALEENTLSPGRRSIAFTITDPEGEPLSAYETEHEKELHLIAVRRDGSGFQHVHPTRGADEQWRTDVHLTPGSWRIFADFTPAGHEGLTLGADVIVPGRVTTVPAIRTSTSTVDGYTVMLTGDLSVGTSSDLTVTVTRDGVPITDLEPYLGAYGHLVALRAGDLAYLHVHPEESGPGPDVPFVAEVPSAGDFHLYFDFQHDGVVRTAEFFVAAGEGEHDEH